MNNHNNNVTHQLEQSKRPHLSRFDTLIQELLQGKHLIALVLAGAACGSGGVEGLAQLQGALM